METATGVLVTLIVPVRVLWKTATMTRVTIPQAVTNAPALTPGALYAPNVSTRVWRKGLSEKTHVRMGSTTIAMGFRMVWTKTALLHVPIWTKTATGVLRTLSVPS